MKQIEVGKLIVDFNLYPRAQVDPVHLGYMREALRAGVIFPPIVGWTKDLRITDGIHRHEMYLYEFGAKRPVDVILKPYKSEAEAFSDAIRLNANHGRALTRYDRVHSILRAEELGLTVEDMADALGMTVEAVSSLRADRIGKLYVPGKRNELVPLKRTIRHMAGQSMTPVQIEANGKLSGMAQLFYVNQLITLIEADLIDSENEQLLAGLAKLAGLLAEYKSRKAA